MRSKAEDTTSIEGSLIKINYISPQPQQSSFPPYLFLVLQKRHQENVFLSRLAETKKDVAGNYFASLWEKVAR